MAEAMHYGKTSFPVTLPEEDIAAELEPNAVELEQKTVPELVRDALAHPIDSKPLKELVKPGESVCIIISDVTRRWQSPETYIPIVVEELESAGIRDEDILILSATGTHRRQTPEEHMGLVTEAVYRRIRVEDHVCTDEDNLQMVGTTSTAPPSCWTSGPWRAITSSSPAAWCTTSWRASAAAARASCRASPAGRPS